MEQDPQDLKILAEFQTESKKLLNEMKIILEDCGTGAAPALRLEEYGNLVDRIMGGAKSIAVVLTVQVHPIYKVSDYAEVCKVVGYKTSQIKDHDAFFEICIALLLDATEVLEELVLGLRTMDQDDVNGLITQKILDRLKWVSGKFGEDGQAGRAPREKKGKLNQKNIDDLLKKLGV